MKTFYLDNFRGFTKTTIPLTDVTFCVGENSSGKTSFLSLVHLFSTQRFWFDQLFEGAESAFGHFDDIVSINSDDRRYFRIGFAEYSNNGDEGAEPYQNAFLFSYKRSGGMPKLHKLTFSFRSSEIVILFAKTSVRYKVIQHDREPEFSDFSKGDFNGWVEEHASSSMSGYRVLPAKYKYPYEEYPLVVVSLVRQMLESESDGDSDVYFGIPRPSFGGEMAWLAPIRTKPRRTYDEVRSEFSPEGEHTPYVVKKILDTEGRARKFSNFIGKFGKESGLFTEVRVHRFGSSVTSPFELEIVLDKKPLNISSVGYGVSQALPVAVELFVRAKNSWFAIQQPEVHLHPRAQAAFGEMILELFCAEGKRFLIETHSDFTIDRYRIAHKNSDLKPTAQILFFERKAGKNIPVTIPILDDGELCQDQPDSYRRFFLNEELRILGLD